MWFVGLGLLMVACGAGPDGSASGVDQTPEAGSSEPHGVDSSDHGHHGHASGSHQASRDTDAQTLPRSTEETLAVLQAMDPERLAGLHRHEHPEHEPGRHPNGVDPERIVIPAIGVDAEVIELGLQANGEMEVPTDFSQAGWFALGPRPGRVGPAVIAGHVDSRSGPAVFFDLVELEPGDEIEVHGSDGEVVVFAVRETEQHPKDGFPTDSVYSGTPGPELRLVTCGGEFDHAERSYRDNIIVYAERIDR
jgi:hypothetical protein